MRQRWTMACLVLAMACGGKADDDTTEDGATDVDADTDTDTDADSDTDTDTDTDSDTDTDTDTDSDTDTDTDSDTDTDTDTAETADTGLVLPADVVSVSCAPQVDHALRVDCSVDLAAEGVATLTFSAAGHPTRTATTGAGTSVSTTAIGLRPGVSYDVEADAGAAPASTTVATDALPTGPGDLVTTVSGAPVGTFDAVLSPFTCGGEDGLVAIDSDGEVVWYELVDAQATGGLGGITGYDVAPDGTLLYAYDTDDVVHARFDGEELFRIDGLTYPQHHDVATDGQYHYLLDADDLNQTVVDGFTVLDDSGNVLATWRYRDHTTVPPADEFGGFWSSVWPNSEDWSHGNSIELDGDHVLLSLRPLDAVVRVMADPGSPDFGTIDWTITGRPNPEAASDVTWTAGGFDGQHHALRWSDGRLAVFDNAPPFTDSRGLIFEVDWVNATATESEAFDMPIRCAIQGSMYEIDGGALVTCQDNQTVYGFETGSALPDWTLEVRCPGGMPTGTFARGMPITW